MKYIRTKDGRIVEECNLEPGFKQTRITLIRKRDNKTLTQIICDDMDDYVEMIVVGEYCKCHNINPKDIKLEREILLNDILKQADTIPELCDEFVIKYKDGTHDTLNYDFSQRLKYMEMEQYNMELTFGNCDLFGAIWTDKGLIYVAKMNDKGKLELL